MSNTAHIHETLNRRIAREEILPRLNDELIEEHRENPFDDYSDDLHRVLTFVRRTTNLKFVVVVTDPHQEWTLARVTGERGEPPELLPDERYGTQREVEHAAFRKRVAAFRERFGEDGGSSND